MKRGTAFFVVWNPDAGYPLRQHELESEARAEAERLAHKHVGEFFYVMQANSVSRVEKPSITHELIPILPF